MPTHTSATERAARRADAETLAGPAGRGEPIGRLDAACEAAGLDVIGVDEAGRGPLVGSLFAAAVHLPRELFDPSHPAHDPLLGRLDDSKRLTDRRRRELAPLIRAHALVEVVEVTAADIDRIGINPANHGAMRQAAAQLAVRLPDRDGREPVVLIDGYRLAPVAAGGRELATWQVVKGDARSVAIAAASVIAKVARDDHAAGLDRAYPHLALGPSGGYGTSAHLAALEAHGPSPHHRRSFKPLRVWLDEGRFADV